jgi:hypothetical protein
MAETLRELVVALSLDSSNFSRNMRTINAQIKEAESTFRLAGAGVYLYYRNCGLPSIKEFWYDESSSKTSVRVT